MFKHIILPVFFAVFFLFMYGCNKNDNLSEDEVDNVIDIDSGKFLALVDSTKWHPAFHYAVYYHKWNQLWIFVSSDNGSSSYTLNGGINLDSTKLLKKYLLEPNGDNTFRLNYKGSFFSDQNKIDAGGHFTLTKFDTVKKTISGELQFIGYDIYSPKKATFSSTKIEDIPLKINTGNYSGNNASCTVQGATTTNWQSKNLHAEIDCASSWTPGIYTDQILYIAICSVFKNYPSYRNVFIRVPVTNKPGKHLVYPDVAPYIYCGDKHVVSTYNDHTYNKKFQAVSGEFNIISIDSVNRKLEATFNIQYRDASSNETVNISNGKINLKAWIGVGEPRL
jgi:hypothetical protein